MLSTMVAYSGETRQPEGYGTQLADLGALSELQAELLPPPSYVHANCRKWPSSILALLPHSPADDPKPPSSIEQVSRT